MAVKVRTAVWMKHSARGMEFAQVRLTSRTLRAVGVAVASEPVPYRLDYVLDARRGYVTDRLRAATRGDGWRRQIELRRAASGSWSIAGHEGGDARLPPAGGDATPLTSALDCDLGFSPVTNSLPVLRSGLLRGGGPLTFTMAWISVPDLGVVADEQRYTFVRAEGEQCVIRYEAGDGSFTSEITFDGDGIVLDYPGIARRLV
jgi:uncharacterized protein